MTETLETSEPLSEPGPPLHLCAHRPSRLNQAAAWVAIVAGVVFIVGSIFFTGFFLGRHSGHDGGGRHHGGPGSSQRLIPMPPGMPMGPGMPPPPPGAPTTAPSAPPAR